MPHLILTHSFGDNPLVADALATLSQTAQAQGFKLDRIKAYAIRAENAHLGGQPDAALAHLTFRLMNKPDRSREAVMAWLDELVAVLQNALPDGTTLTAEAAFLPDMYRSVAA